MEQPLYFTPFWIHGSPPYQYRYSTLLRRSAPAEIPSHCQPVPDLGHTLHHILEQCCSTSCVAYLYLSTAVTFFLVEGQ
jgi:hypothetical protein